MATPKIEKPQTQTPADPVQVTPPNVQTGGASIDIASAVSDGVNKGFDNFQTFNNTALVLAQKRKALAEDDLNSKYQLAAAEVIQEMKYRGKSYADEKDVMKAIDGSFVGKIGDQYAADFVTNWRQSQGGAKTIAVSNLEAGGQHLIAQYNYQYQQAGVKGNEQARIAFTTGNHSMIDTDYSAWLDENTALNEADKEKLMNDANRQYDLGMLERMIVTKPALLQRSLEKQLSAINVNKNLDAKQKAEAAQKAKAASFEKLTTYAEKTESDLRNNPDFLPYLTPREVENAIKAAQLMLAKKNGGKEPKEDTMVDYIDALSLRLRDLQGAGYATSQEQILKDIEDGTLPGGDILSDYVKRHNINNLEELRGVYANNSLELLNSYGISAKDQQTQEGRITSANYDNDYDFEQTKQFTHIKNMFDTSDKVRVDDESGKYFEAKEARTLNILDNPAEYANRIITLNDAISSNHVGRGNKKAAHELQYEMLVELGRAGAVTAKNESTGTSLSRTALDSIYRLSTLGKVGLAQESSDTWFDVASRQINAQFEISPLGSVDGVRNEELAGTILSNVVGELKNVAGYDFKANDLATLEVVRQYTEALTSAALKGRSGVDADVYVDNDDNVYIQNYTGQKKAKKNEYEEEEHWKGSYDKQVTPHGNFNVLKDKNGNVLAVEYLGDK